MREKENIDAIVDDQSALPCAQSVVGIRMEVGESISHSKNVVTDKHVPSYLYRYSLHSYYSFNMIVQKLFAALLVIFVLIDARPIHHKIR
jgi:hypothetical protein